MRVDDPPPTHLTHRTAAAIVLALVAPWLASCEPSETMPNASDSSTPPGWVERVVQPRMPVGGKPPLLVLLHGIGADENDLPPIAAALDPRFLTVSLRAPHRYYDGYAWFSIAFRRDGTVDPDLGQAHAALADLVRWLQAAPARLGTDPEQTFVLGFSQGAMMSLGVLGTAPQLLAGVVALSGRGPTGLFPETASPDAIARVPVLAAHGTYDDVLPVAHGRAIRDALTPRLRDFTYREFPVAHGISDDEVVLLTTWLSERLRAE